MRYWQKNFKLSPLITCEGEGDQGGGGGGDSWQTQLPESVQGWDEAKNAETPEAFWDQVTNMRSHLGQSIRIPSKEAGTEDWAAFNTKLQEAVPTLINKPDLSDEENAAQFYGSLGRPENPADYTIPEIEGADMSPAEAFRDIAHKQGLTQRQFEAIVSGVTEGNLATHAQQMEQMLQDKQSLQKEWGFAYDKNNKIVENFLIQSGAPEGVRNVFNSDAMDSKAKKWFLDLASKIGGEGHSLAGDRGNLDSHITPDEATKRISEIMNNKQHPYWNKQDPSHAIAKREMRELYEYKLGSDARKAAPSSSFAGAGK